MRRGFDQAKRRVKSLRRFDGPSSVTATMDKRNPRSKDARFTRRRAEWHPVNGLTAACPSPIEGFLGHPTKQSVQY
jgi:hypothetical protein